MLTESHLQTFQATGHVTVNNVLDAATVQAAREELSQWSQQFLAELPVDQRRWYLERGQLRKLDHPVATRPFFRELAGRADLVAAVEQLIGPGVTVFFSQVFCKPPEVGGPKPVHQDNFYFGPDDEQKTLTVWIAIDEATTENGCLFFADGSHSGGVVDHFAPPDEPFNLQVQPKLTSQYEMTAAPVAAGGISFHHGNTWHQSSANRSSDARRAVVFHYLRNDAMLVKPTLNYDLSLAVRVSTAD
ncbi:MAG: hypothetical protein Fues2KO_08550 [Fuerstiella sp.]